MLTPPATGYSFLNPSSERDDLRSLYQDLLKEIEPQTDGKNTLSHPLPNTPDQHGVTLFMALALRHKLGAINTLIEEGIKPNLSHTNTNGKSFQDCLFKGLNSVQSEDKPKALKNICGILDTLKITELSELSSRLPDSELEEVLNNDIKTYKELMEKLTEAAPPQLIDEPEDDADTPQEVSSSISPQSLLRFQGGLLQQATQVLTRLTHSSLPQQIFHSLCRQYQSLSKAQQAITQLAGTALTTADKASLLEQGKILSQVQQALISLSIRLELAFDTKLRLMGLINHISLIQQNLQIVQMMIPNAPITPAHRPTESAFFASPNRGSSPGSPDSVGHSSSHSHQDPVPQQLFRNTLKQQSEHTLYNQRY